VFGDIGTSPLYALRETFLHDTSLAPTPDHVLGVLSTLFWAVTLTVTIKYVTLIMRADNKGEGGVLALATLASHGLNGGSPRIRHGIVTLAVIGLALFYGDAIITPAVSVMGAVEGLSAAAPGFEPYIVPLVLVILVALFLLQARGTADVGRLFGPVMFVWFVVLGVLGAWQIAKNPAVLWAINPLYAARLIADQGLGIFWAFGSIVLAVTGAEALYADMGHFGRRPIRTGWLALVMPGLLINYFGQGALIIEDPTRVRQVFFELVPQDYIIFLVALATLAAVIASQAVITGVFSLTRQAIQLGYLPRMSVRHTSPTEIGQIYIPRVNWLLMAGVLALVVSFRSSGNLAAAYGISVTGAMAIDAVLAGLVAAWRWGWGPAAAVVFGTFFLLDFAYFAANALKIPAGGWFPLLVAAAFAYIVVTWRRGRRAVWDKLYAHALPIGSFLDRLDPALIRVRGTAVYMTGDPEVVPTALLHNIKHNQVLHEQVVLMTVRTRDIPYVPEAQRIEVAALGKGFYQVAASYGFLDQPDVPQALALCRARDLRAEPMRTSFFLGRETLIPTPSPPLGPVEARVFTWLSSGNLSATTYFQIPPERVVELGTQLEV
jgi:KUP system potassium uptake protein